MKHIINFNKYFKLYESLSITSNIETIVDNMGSVSSDNISNELKAFLDVIAFAEGTYKEDGYKTMFGGSKFDDYSDHPRKIISKSGYDSSAAGRYQFLSNTWDQYMKGESFDPKNQDIAVLKLIDSKNLIKTIESGNIEKVIKNLSKTWASFPYSPYGQNVWYGNNDKDKMDILLKVYDYRLGIYSDGKNNRPNIKKDVEFPITRGDESENIKKIQEILVANGYKLPKHGIDSRYGPETIKAVKDFKKDKLKISSTILDSDIDESVFNKIIEYKE